MILVTLLSLFLLLWELFALLYLQRGCLGVKTSFTMLSIEEVNLLDFETFISHFGNVIEHCPVLAAALWAQKPFHSIEEFISKMTGIVQALPISGSIYI